MVINLQINLSRPHWMRNWSLKRTVMVFLALALLLPPAAFVAASDIFSDVPEQPFPRRHQRDLRREDHQRHLAGHLQPRT
jgi:hypothetical protein